MVVAHTQEPSKYLFSPSPSEFPQSGGGKKNPRQLGLYRKGAPSGLESLQIGSVGGSDPESFVAKPSWVPHPFRSGLFSPKC